MISFYISFFMVLSNPWERVSMFVEDIRLGKDVGAAELVEMMGRMGGFMGPHLAKGAGTA
jgi:deoxyhypusine synthase